ncbi:MAG: amidohydrolase [Bacteroidia bacterium]
MKKAPGLKMLFCLSAFLFYACGVKPKLRADLIVHHAKVYTVDSKFSVAECFAVKDGRIVAVGKNDSIMAAYEATEMLDAKGKTILPGLIDAHAHYYEYGRGLQEVDLTGTTSYKEVIQHIKDFLAKHPGKLGADKNFNTKWIIGRGWDQNNWVNKEFPDREELDKLFPTTPVFLTRIDGHAALANEVALKLAGIIEWREVKGGTIVTRSKGGSQWGPSLSGLLLDNAMTPVLSIIPPPSAAEMKTALLDAQQNCFAAGLTTVTDAGLDKKIIDLIDSLQKSGELKMRIYAMLTPNAENLNYYLSKGQYKTERLNVRSFKFYADGALGSRGACLRQPYSDKPETNGYLLQSPDYYSKMALKMFEKGFQMNTHCIGDSAVHLILKIYDNLFRDYIRKGGHIHFDPRWRIEHFQVTTPEDIALLTSPGIKPPPFIPSVQPTHATSDMYWAEKRLGQERIKFAYVYNDLRKAAGIVALGTDFPVEDISPLKTFYAAIARTDRNGWPDGGFQPENALSRQDALRGMTIWAAYASFEEKEKGSIESGKFADFIMLSNDIMTMDIQEFHAASVLATYVNGVKVY